MNRLVLGTGNKSELLVGYFTKYGDGGVDLLPLGDLYKTDVQKIATYLDIPEKIIKKPPSAGLWYGQTDEEEMGITYTLLDKILYLMADQNLNVHHIADKLEISEEEVLRIKTMMKAALHKLTPPPIPKIRRT
jgi:NAD+ synthase